MKRPYLINIKDLNTIKDPTSYSAGADFAKKYYGWTLPGDHAMVNLDSAELVKMRENREAVALEDFNSALCRDTLLRYVIEQFKISDDTCPPLYVPQKGDKINIPSYLLKYYSTGGNQFKLSEDGQYIIGSDLYFLVGDNWAASFDSRQIGMIKREDIIGVMNYKHPQGPNDKIIKERPNYFSLW